MPPPNNAFEKSVNGKEKLNQEAFSASSLRKSCYDPLRKDVGETSNPSPINSYIYPDVSQMRLGSLYHPRGFRCIIDSRIAKAKLESLFPAGRLRSYLITSPHFDSVCPAGFKLLPKKFDQEEEVLE